MKLLLALTTAAGLLLLSAGATASDGIMVPDNSAWVRATPPGSSTTAVYLTLMNHTDSDVNLTSASIDMSDRVELHTVTNEDGLMKMQEITSITIPAGGQAELKPGAEHIMVFNLTEQLKTGTEVDVELTFDNGDTETLTVPVKKGDVMPAGHSMKHEEHDHKKKKDSETHGNS